MSGIAGRKTFKALILLVDASLILAAYLTAFLLRYNDLTKRNWDSFLSLIPWILLLGLFVLTIYELYSIQRKTIWDVMRNLFVAITLFTFLTMAISFLFRQFALPRSVILISYFVALLYLFVWKFILFVFRPKNRSRRLLLLAEENDSARLIIQIKYSTSKTKISRTHPNTDLSRIFEMVESHDYIVISSNIEQEKKSSVIYHAMRCNKEIYVVPSLYDLLLTKSDITSLEDTMVLSVKPFGLTAEERFMKRVFDFGLAAVGLLIIAPVMLIVACAIKLENPRGSVIYKQKRIGLNNKEFIMYKFRTMVENAEKLTGPTLAENNDPRITKVGKFLRSVRLDEFPQLFNVLKGDMSICGPRPERDFFTKQLNQIYDAYKYRNKVKPGITGYAQIMGKYTTDVKDKLLFDLYYIRNYSLWMDIVIILRTFVVLFDRRKADGLNPKDHSLNNEYSL